VADLRTRWSNARGSYSCLAAVLWRSWNLCRSLGLGEKSDPDHGEGPHSHYTIQVSQRVWVQSQTSMCLRANPLHLCSHPSAPPSLPPSTVVPKVSSRRTGKEANAEAEQEGWKRGLPHPSSTAPLTRERSESRCGGRDMSSTCAWGLPLQNPLTAPTLYFSSDAAIRAHLPPFSVLVSSLSL
jgi:hypothetical protein